MEHQTIVKQEQAASQQKVAKVVKVRRSRQPRNAQLSVARRNERERNRVKMVNNGFALLREHLPAEDLQACESGSETPDGSSSGGHQAKCANKAKKYSKVETLRAAIQRIKMLEQLIRSTEPEFESINLNTSGPLAANQMPTSYDEEPLSVREPLSCDSSSAQSASQHQYQQRLMHTSEASQHLSPAFTTASTTIYNANCGAGHFIKLEAQASEPLSPEQPQATSQQPDGLNPQHLSQYQPEAASHTYTWIQQHQSSFMEQQQQYQQQRQFEPDWYAQQQKANWFAQQQSLESEQHPVASSPLMSQQQQQQQHQLAPAQQQVDSPIWFGGRSSSNGSPMDSLAGPQSANSQPIMTTFSQHHQPHQISLYSQ